MKGITLTKLSIDFFCLSITSEKGKAIKQDFDFFEKHTFFLTEKEVVKLKTEIEETLKLDVLESAQNQNIDNSTSYNLY